MFSYVWPITLVVFANTLYQICAKSVPQDPNPFASLTVTYAVSFVASLILFFTQNKGGSLLAEYGKLNWVPFVFGLTLVGLEVGFIFAYKAGWQVSTASIVQSAILAVALIAIGFLMYHESLSWNKIVGVAVCLVGLVIVNYK